MCDLFQIEKQYNNLYKKSHSDKYPLFQSKIPLFSKEEAESMSKLGIVQKDLVQGIPEYILDHSIL